MIEDLPQHEALPLVGLAEIAMRAGVQKPVVAVWRTKRVYFPEPVAQVGRSAVWWWPDVEAWLEATGRETAAGWTREQIINPGQERFLREFKEALAQGKATRS